MLISAEEKLAVTESYESLQYQFCIHKSTIRKFLPDACEAIYSTLKEEYFILPSSQNTWLKLTEGAEKRWQFPNSFAAADGKHVAIYHPHRTGSTFNN